MDTPQSDLEAIRHLLADLTARVYRIESRLGMSAQPATEARTPAAAAAPPPPRPETRPVVASDQTRVRPSRPPSLSTPPYIPPRPVATLHVPDPDLESRIGSHWLNRIGIAAMLIGISYFLKFAFDNNWIGPAGRVTIGLIAGIAIVFWSERFRNKGYKAFSYSLKAVGIGALYLSIWAAFHLYSLIPSSVAFVMMLVVTASAAAMALGARRANSRRLRAHRRLQHSAAALDRAEPRDRAFLPTSRFSTSPRCFWSPSSPGAACWS